jgi:hypothetical protein
VASDPIQRALDVQDDPADAYPFLLAAWREERSTALGDLLRLLGDHISDARGPVFPGLPVGQDPGPSLSAALSTVLDAKDPADTRRLAEAAFQLPRERGVALWMRLEDRLPDPNATAVLVEMLATHSSRWMDESCQPFWGWALGRIEEGADRSVLAGLDAAAHVVRNARDGRFPLDALLRRRIPDLQTTIRTHLELARPREDPRIQAWRDALRPVLVDRRLWSACTSDPTDRAARQVLRDALLEAGDPRGQALAGDAARRYHPRWAASVAPVVDLDDCRFDGPFLVEARLDSDARPLPWIGLADWRTVEVLDGTDWPGCEALFVGPGARGWPVLQTLRGVTGDVFASDGLPALRHFEERLHAESFALRDIRQPLTTLVLGATAQHRAGVLDPTAPVFETLQHLTLLRGHDRWLDGLPDWLEQIPARCRVELPPSSLDLRLPWHVVLPDRTEATRVELTWTSALPPSPSQADAVRPLLRAAAAWTVSGGPVDLEATLRDAL